MFKVSEDLISSLKRYGSSAMSLVKLEMEQVAKRAGTQTVHVFAIILLWSLAIVWLSVSLTKLLSRWVPEEAAGSITAALFLAIGLLLYARGKRKDAEICAAGRNVILKLSEETSTEKGRLLRQLQIAQQDIAETSSELKDEATRALNPLNKIKDAIIRHPEKIVFGTFCVGLYLGTTKRKRF